MANADLGILLQSLRGKVGKVVFNKGKAGATTVRARVRGTNPRTAPQVSVRGNLARAAQIYKGFTPAQVAAWRAFASTLQFTGRKSGRKYTPSPLLVFTELGAKFLQVNPGGTVPLTPPTSSFAGEAFGVTAAGAAGKVTFSAAVANTAGVRTELLLQPLKSRNRNAAPKGYRTRAFVAFAAGALTSDVTVPPGAYAPAYRFVNAATGQMAPLQPLPVVVVA